MNQFENEVVRPAVIAALAQIPEWTGHVSSVEKLTQMGMRPSSAQFGAGTPDILGSIAWIAKSGLRGAQWICLELKSPRLSPGAWCRTCVRACSRAGTRSICCSGKIEEVRASRPAGVVSDEQISLHEAWREQGRWIYVVETPQEAKRAIEEVRFRLRGAGLEPVDATVLG